MQIKVKILGGDDITIDVTSNTTILELKHVIEERLNKPIAQQKLIYMGRTLNDEQTISAYDIKDGCRIILIIIKPESLRDIMYRSFRKYYNEQQSMRLTKEFMLDFEKKLKQLSLDDIERLAQNILGVTFEVIEGGFLDIDIKVTGPDNVIMHESEKESSSRLAFVATTTGIYTACFDNKKSSMTPKLIMFSIEVGEAPHRPVGAPDESEVGHTKLEDMIRELSGTLTSVKHEQEYMHVRDKIHRSINESTNTRVVLWSTFEALVLVLMTIGQVYYLKRFFEVKRVV